MSKRVLVFGTFDGLHAGHLFFLRFAKAQGTHLTVGVARDRHVLELKGKRPITPETKRLETVRALKVVDDARLCDETLGRFDILREIEPNLIVLGHDQQTLEKELIAWMSEQGVYIPMMRSKKV
jgi:FAD synthetase